MTNLTPPHTHTPSLPPLLFSPPPVATLRDLGGGKDKEGFPTDGVNVWNAITTNTSSPRTEFLLNIDPCAGHGIDGTCAGSEAAYRMGDWKLMIGVANDTWYPLPTSEASPRQALAEMGAGAGGPMGSVVWDAEAKVNGAGAATASLRGSADSTNWLFNVKTDPNEHNNVYDANPDIVKTMTAKINALAAEVRCVLCGCV